MIVGISSVQFSNKILVGEADTDAKGDGGV